MPPAEGEAESFPSDMQCEAGRCPPRRVKQRASLLGVRQRPPGHRGPVRTAMQCIDSLDELTLAGKKYETELQSKHDDSKTKTSF